MTAEKKKLDAAKLEEAATTALNCFRAMYDAMDDGAEAEEILADPRYWPLSLLRYALGNSSDKATAEENWLDGEYIGPDETDDEEEETDDE